MIAELQTSSLFCCHMWSKSLSASLHLWIVFFIVITPLRYSLKKTFGKASFLTTWCCLLVWGATQDAGHHPAVCCDGRQCLTKLLPPSGRSTEKASTLFFALLVTRKCCPVMIKRPLLQHPRCSCRCLQDRSSFLFLSQLNTAGGCRLSSNDTDWSSLIPTGWKWFLRWIGEISCNPAAGRWSRIFYVALVRYEKIKNKNNISEQLLDKGEMVFVALWMTVQGPI